MPTPNAPPDNIVARFRADVERLIGDGGAARFGIAVSGGPDSMGALMLANAAFPEHVEAATVDHGLRAASADEAAHVAAVCASFAIPHETHRVTIARRGNVSANARTARYAALEEWRARRRLDWIVTAHHADDQRETVIMRLNRSSGVGGLAGIRAHTGQIIRPLLTWGRAELALICTCMGIATIADPSNIDDRYDRARLRKALANADWLNPEAIAASAAALADADAALAWSAQHWMDARVHPHPRGGSSFDASGLPAEIVRRILLRCLTALNPDADPDGPALSRLHAALLGGQKATLDGVAFDGRVQPWRITVAPPRRATPPATA